MITVETPEERQTRDYKMRKIDMTTVWIEGPGVKTLPNIADGQELSLMHALQDAHDAGFKRGLSVAKESESFGKFLIGVMAFVFLVLVTIALFRGCGR